MTGLLGSGPVIEMAEDEVSFPPPADKEARSSSPGTDEPKGKDGGPKDYIVSPLPLLLTQASAPG